MTRFSGIGFALAMALLSSLFATELPAQMKPNFVVINADDLGYGDIGPYGSKRNRTPNLDRMAREGRKLTSFYAAPVCSPSRASLMTGCYPKRVLPISGVLFPSSAVGLSPRERTVAELLKESGYSTACIGKWHLGDQPEFLPRRRGFDYYLGIPYSNDMGPAEEGARSSLGAPIPKHAASAKSAPTETGLPLASVTPLPLIENETVIARVKQDEQQGIVERYTVAALKFIRTNQSKPFFLYLPHNAVHFPIYPGKKWAGYSSEGLYSDWVQELDWSVGQVLDTLRELKLDSQTLVIFTSDNGGTPRGLNTPLRGHKGGTLEGGMREPTIAWWPGRIPADTSSDAITGMIDVLPTFVKLAGGKIPTDLKIDGGDIWPVLAGEAGAKSPHDAFYYFHGLKLQAVRSGAWKLHLPGADRAVARAAKQHAEVPASSFGGQLYNLDVDIGESKNVAQANPEVVRRLQAFVDAMKDDLGLDGLGPGVRSLGREENPEPLISKDGKVRLGFEPK